ncbi:hypothetical protein H4582DRAFT_2075003 [Lactarius indigo]|nr:hypothetical protein H4582DRAFT_2075003 [Lactarius indigo]
MSYVPFGAITALYIDTVPAASELSGKYLTECACITVPNKKTHDLDLATKLREWCEEEVKDITS